ELGPADAALVLVAVAIVIQSLAVNVTNVYTAGLSLVNTAPFLGRLRASLIVGVAAIVLSGFPGFVDHAERWVVHLGNVAAPPPGVVVADYVIVRRRKVDVPALYEPRGRYRFLRGVNAAAIVAVVTGVGVYYAVPHGWLKVVWGVLSAGLAYVVLEAV